MTAPTSGIPSSRPASPIGLPTKSSARVAREFEEVRIHVLNRFPVYVDNNDAVFGCLEKPLKSNFCDLPPLGDIFDRKKGQPLLRVTPRNAPGIQPHRAPTDVRTIVLDLVILKRLGLNRAHPRSSRSRG